jgi:hypothetical protein
VTAASPHSGDDTHDLIDDAIYQLAERRSKWLGDPLAAITLIASHIDQAERMLPEHVLLASTTTSAGTTSPPPSPPAPSRPNSATAPIPRSPTADGPTTGNPPAPLHVHAYLTLHMNLYADRCR